MEINVKGQDWILLPEKALFWKQEQALVLSDLHLSKDMHFRKHGFAVPSGPTLHTLETLTSIIQQYGPKKILFLGDLFHSDMNQAIQGFYAWRQQHHFIKCILIAGNHDILPLNVYFEMGLTTVVDELEIGAFRFNHEPPLRMEEKYVVCGHLHPATRISGRGRQSIKMPCFWIREQYTVLPAFGAFTGSKSIRPTRNDRVIGIAENNLYQIQ